jgi:hypothetical protein
MANTGVPRAAMAAAAWSWVEKMLQEAQRTSAPSAYQGLDEHGGLDGHVQRAGDARAAAAAASARVLVADRHQAGHLGLGDRDLLAAPAGQRQVGDRKVVLQFSHGVHVFSLNGGREGRRRSHPLPVPGTGLSSNDPECGSSMG